MDVNKALKYFVSCGAIIYTAMTFVIIIVNYLFSHSESQKVIVVENFIYLLIFAYILSLGNTLRKNLPISKALRWVIHAVCYLTGFLIFVILCGMTSSSALILTATFAVLYAIGAFIVAICERKRSTSAVPLKTTDTEPRNTRKITSKSSSKSSSKSKKDSKAQEPYKNLFS